MRGPMNVAALLLIAIAAFLAILWLSQRRLMYFPAGEVPTPVASGLTAVEPVAFETEDGLRLGGWFFPVASLVPRATVIVFNGNAGSRAHRVPLALALRERDAQVLLVDYRGYGGNPGSPTERGLAADARAARDYVVSRPDVNASRLVYYGESLGTAVAVALALGHPPAALVLRSPFTSVTDLAQHHYSWLPVRLLLRDRYDALAGIRRVRVPLLVIAGEEDRIVPIAFSQQLYAAAGQPKAFVAVPNARHNDFELLAGDTAITAIARFIETRVTDPEAGQSELDR